MNSALKTKFAIRYGRVVLMMSLVCGTCIGQTIYTVVSDSGTVASPALLEEASVTVDDGGGTVVVPFNEVTFVADSIFRKQGSGFLASTTKFGSFTGEIRIEEGALVLTANGQLGPMSSAAPTVVISNGASLVQNNTDATQAGKWTYYNQIHVGGTGVDGKGALRNVSTVSTRGALRGAITLTDDALFYTDENANHWGINDGIVIDFQGHELSFDGATSSTGNFAMNKITYRNPGSITVLSDRGYPYFQVGATWNGDASNLMTLENGAAISGYNGGAFDCPWTLRLKRNSKLLFSEPFGLWQNAEKWVFKGPIDIAGDTVVQLNDSFSSCVFAGPLAGAATNTLAVRRGYLHLKCPQNDFDGLLEVGPGTTGGQKMPPGLGIWTNGVFKASSTNGLRVANGNVVLWSDESVDLPRIDYSVGVNTNMAISGNRGVVASLKKSGPGALDITANLVVTGRTEVAEGTLRLAPVPEFGYSLNGGLKESYAVINDAGMTEATMNSVYKPVWYTDDIAWRTNETYDIVTSVMSFPSLGEENTGNLTGRWKQYMFARYEGYIWNRTNADVTWTFALAFCKAGMMFVDGQKVMESSAWNRLQRNNVTLSKGCHKFELRLWANAYNNPGARSSTTLENGTTSVTWKNNFGFVYDAQGRMSADPNDYCWPTNGVSVLGVAGGDGVLFTLDDKSPTEQDPVRLASMRTAFSNLVCRAGTTVDLNDAGKALIVPRFEGFTSVTNGDLTVSESWKLSSDDFTAPGGRLFVAGKLRFAAGACLDLTSLARSPRGALSIASAKDGIEGLPTLLTRPTQEGQWTLVKETDAAGYESLTLSRQSGLMVIVK